MTEPQVWVLIGVFGAAMFGVLGLIIPLVNRSTHSLIGELRGEVIGEMKTFRSDMRGEISELRSDMRGEISNIRGEISELRSDMNRRFESVDIKLEHLDRDVSYLMRREFGTTGTSE